MSQACLPVAGDIAHNTLKAHPQADILVQQPQPQVAAGCLQMGVFAAFIYQEDAGVVIAKAFTYQVHRPLQQVIQVAGAGNITRNFRSSLNLQAAHFELVGAFIHPLLLQRKALAQLPGHGGQRQPELTDLIIRTAIFPGEIACYGVKRVCCPRLSTRGGILASRRLPSGDLWRQRFGCLRQPAQRRHDPVSPQQGQANQQQGHDGQHRQTAREGQFLADAGQFVFQVGHFLHYFVGAGHAGQAPACAGQGRKRYQQVIALSLGAAVSLQAGKARLATLHAVQYCRKTRTGCCRLQVQIQQFLCFELRGIGAGNVGIGCCGKQQRATLLVNQEGIAALIKARR